MTLAADEFIRRFLLHVPPEGFQHIRHYGFLANRYRETKLARCRQLLQLPPPSVEQPPAAELSRPLPETHRPIITRLSALRQRTHAADRHLPGRVPSTRTTTTRYFMMLRFLSHRSFPSSAEFAADSPVLRPLAPRIKIACIAASQCTLNPSPTAILSPFTAATSSAHHQRTSRRSTFARLPRFNSHSSTTSGAA